MIFVTVGTHEQQFNRLVEEVDRLKGTGGIKDDVFIQTGFSTYAPVNCQWKKILSYSEMEEYGKKSGIVITHGGPASFISVIQKGKIPIVVPRQKQYDEHVNDHQLDFCRKYQERYGNILVVEDIRELADVIKNYKKLDKKSGGSLSHNAEFCKNLENEIRELF